MKLFKHIILKMQIKNIFILLILVFTVIPALACLAISGSYTKMTIRNYSEQYLTNVNDVLTSNLSDMIYQTNLYSVTVTSLPEITLTLTSDKPYEVKNGILNRSLLSFIEHNSTIDGLLITAKGEAYLSFPGNTDYVFNDTDFFNSLEKSRLSIYDKCVLINGKNYVVLGKKFFNFNTGVDIGNLIFFIDEEHISSAYNNSITSNNTFYLTCNDSIISHSDKSVLNSTLLIPDIVKENNKDNINTVFEHTLDLPLASSELKTICILSSEDEQSLISRIKHRTYTISLFILAMSVLFAVILAKSLTKTLAKFKTSMESFADNPDTEFALDTSNEISALSITFDKMINQIQNLIRMNNIEKEKQKNAEFLAMQAQISPHFIFNALDTAYCMAKLNGQEDIEEILYALASFFRLGLHNASKVIPIRDEIEHVKSFLVIEALRFPQLFDVEYKIDEDVLDCKMIGVILQPIVENCIKHGFRDIDYKGKITISVSRENENTILFSVADNGNGMASPPDLTAQSESKSYGLKNVNERLTIAYSSECGLSFVTAPKQGTTVSFKITD